MCFVRIANKTDITFLCCLKWLFFITWSEYVYCAVRYESLTTKRPCHGSGLSPQKPSSSQVSPFEIYGEQSGTGTGVLRVTWFLPVSIIPPMFLTHLHLHVVLTRKTKGRSLETFRKAMLFRKLGTIGYESTSTFFVFTELNVTDRRDFNHLSRIGLTT
jgi:hypothetical protein